MEGGVVLTLIAVYAVYRIVLNRERRRELRALGGGPSTDPMPGWLPHGFPEEILNDFFPSLIMGRRWTNIHNVVGRADGGDYVLAFDISVLRGGSSTAHTVVARKSFNFQMKNKVTAGYRYRVFGEWQALTKRDRVLPFSNTLLSATEIERQWKLLR